MDRRERRFLRVKVSKAFSTISGILIPERHPSFRLYTAISRKVVGKKNIKLYATRPKGGLGIHWNFAYWPKGNLQVCFFARGKFVFPLRGLYL